MTQSAFLPKKSQLDVIREQVTYKEEEDEDDGKDGGGSTNGRAIGMRAKKGSNNLFQDKNRVPGTTGVVGGAPFIA